MAFPNGARSEGPTMKIEGVRQERFVTELRCDRCSRAALNGESEFDEFTSIDFTAGYGSVFGDGDTRQAVVDYLGRLEYGVWS